MARIHDSLYINIGADNKGNTVLTVYKVTSGGHIILNELRGKDAMFAYSFITKQKNAGMPAKLKGE